MPYNFLVAAWQHLLVATFETEKKLLEKYLPYGTELHEWNGKYLLSLVAFMFNNTSLLGIPMPFYRQFEEVNLRFYVRQKTKEGWKNGVVFIKEVVPATLIGWVAHFLYRENFVALPMKHSIRQAAGRLTVEYSWQIKQQTNYLKIITAEKPQLPGTGTIDSFITERYFAYTRKSNNRTLNFGIRHSPWKIYPLIDFSMKINVDALYGKEFCHTFEQQPVSVFLVDGSRTAVSKPGLIN